MSVPSEAVAQVRAFSLRHFQQSQIRRDPIFAPISVLVLQVQTRAVIESEESAIERAGLSTVNSPILSSAVYQ